MELQAPVGGEGGGRGGRGGQGCLPGVNRRLLPIKAFYFFFFAAFGSLFPLIAVYF